MEITTFIVTVFCLIDDWLKETVLRHRGPNLTLKDSEVVGKLLGIDTDQGLYSFFRREYGAWFPSLDR